MYYRVAISRQPPLPPWQWKSTAFNSLETVLHFLRLYQALPQDRLRVFASSSREGLEEQLTRENQGLESTSVTAVHFLEERRLRSPGEARGMTEHEGGTSHERTSIAVSNQQEMAHHTAWQLGPSSIWVERYTPETLRHIGGQVEALLSRHSSLELYKRSIEWQLALIAAQIHAEDVLLLPRIVFLLLEVRGSGGVIAPLEQIARILGEVGYWKPAAHVQDYHPQDVYYLGKSAQRLFDDYTALDRRVKELHAQLRRIKEDQRMKPEMTPQEVFAGLATASDGAKVQAGVDTIIELLEQTA